MTSEEGIDMTKKDVIDFIGYSIGLVGSGFMALTLYKILKRGYAHYIENNPFIAISEFIAGIGGVSFFVYKLYEISSDKENKKRMELNKNVK